MLKGKVVGTIVSTNKLDALVGYKFLEVQIIENNTLTDKFIVAVDRAVSAGIGETVLVTTGSAAFFFMSLSSAQPRPLAASTRR